MVGVALGDVRPIGAVASPARADGLSVSVVAGAALGDDHPVPLAPWTVQHGQLVMPSAPMPVRRGLMDKTIIAKNDLLLEYTADGARHRLYIVIYTFYLLQPSSHAYLFAFLTWNEQRAEPIAARLALLHLPMSSASCLPAYLPSFLFFSLHFYPSTCTSHLTSHPLATHPPPTLSLARDDQCCGCGNCDEPLSYI